MKAQTKRNLPPVLLASTCLAALLTTAQSATFSLSRDFSYSENNAQSTWSYRLDDFTNQRPSLPLLSLTNRDANTLWGSDFPTPPMMWSEVYLPCATQWVNTATYDDHHLILAVEGRS